MAEPRIVALIDPRIVALIPARAGSVRVPGKNTRELAGHPLLAYSIWAAQEADIFSRIVVSSDSEETLGIARGYGAAGLIAPYPLHRDDCTDIEWVTDAIAVCGNYEAFAILRPTSPFRRGPWIRQAWELFQQHPGFDSLRAVRPCREHPAKMWRADYGVLTPIMQGTGSRAPWHSSPTQTLLAVYTQTAALEIAWTRVLPGSISGCRILQYLTALDAPEALDINTPADWERAVKLAAEHPEYLPEVVML